MGLDADFMSQFSQGAYGSAGELTAAIGLRDLIPGAILDDKIFAPCGYSLNAIVKVSEHTTFVCPFCWSILLSYVVVGALVLYIHVVCFI